jgi:sporulation protein YlmC with PRC-barrel domain
VPGDPKNRLPDELDAHLHLLDRQVVDRDGRNAGKVDDLELTEQEDGPPYVSAILSGPGALGGRIGGRWGEWMGVLHRRLAAKPDGAPARVDFAVVRDIGSDVEVSTEAEALETNAGERWARDHVIGHLPGARHASE